MTRKDGTIPAEDNIRKIMRRALNGVPWPRSETARRMSEILGRTITESMLADFTRNASKGRHVRFPAAWVAAFCDATEDYTLALAVLPERIDRTLRQGEWVVNLGLRIDKTKEDLEKSLERERA